MAPRRVLFSEYAGCPVHGGPPPGAPWRRRRRLPRRQRASWRPRTGGRGRSSPRSSRYASVQARARDAVSSQGGADVGRGRAELAGDVVDAGLGELHPEPVGVVEFGELGLAGLRLHRHVALGPVLGGERGHPARTDVVVGGDPGQGHAAAVVVEDGGDVDRPPPELAGEGDAVAVQGVAYRARCLSNLRGDLLTVAPASMRRRSQAASARSGTGARLARRVLRRELRTRSIGHSIA